MNHNITLVFVLAFALTSAACSNKSNPEPSAPKKESSVEPLQSFKAIAEECQKNLIESDRIWPGQGGFGRTIIHPSSTSFDVKKTDSLVSPFTAYIKLSFIEKSSAGKNEDELNSPSITWVTTVNNWELNYSLQEGKWKFQQAIYSSEMLGIIVSKTSPQPMNVKELFETVPNLEAVCMPK